MNEMNTDEVKIKALLKAAIIEVVEENQEFVREILESGAGSEITE